MGKKMSDSTDVKQMVESVIGCKWSLAVLDMVHRGISRPGAMTRQQPGLSTKVLNERLLKLTRFGILAKTAYPEIPPRVEYHFTPFGNGFINILDAIETLQQQVDATDNSDSPD